MIMLCYTFVWFVGAYLVIFGNFNSIKYAKLHFSCLVRQMALYNVRGRSFSIKYQMLPLFVKTFTSRRRTMSSLREHPNFQTNITNFHYITENQLTIVVRCIQFSYGSCWSLNPQKFSVILPASEASISLYINSNFWTKGEATLCMRLYVGKC